MEHAMSCHRKVRQPFPPRHNASHEYVYGKTPLVRNTRDWNSHTNYPEYETAIYETIFNQI